MNTFETTATVGDHGQLYVAGVPFGPGTEVEVLLREKVPAHANRPPAVADEPPLSIRDLFARARARNMESVGPLRREDLYDRKVLR
jgi:hypothetical protein